jgi:periplasmic protein TonB
MVSTENKNFKIALVVSLICHSILFFPNPGFFLSFSPPETKTKLEVIYQAQSTEAPERHILVSRRETPERAETAKKQIEVKEQPAAGLPEIDTSSETKKDEEQLLAKRSEVKPVVDAQMKQMREFLGYYQLLRVKIQKEVEYPDSLNRGEVYLSFTLSGEGRLKMIKINEQASTSDALLRAAALESIQKASPFPPFPKDFQEEEAVFSVVISFQIK